MTFPACHAAVKIACNTFIESISRKGVSMKTMSLVDLPDHAALKHSGPFSLHVSRDPRDVRDAQALRWRVFVDEMGAVLDSPVWGYDVDRFDSHCDHLIVRSRPDSAVVGTYRILTPEAVRRLGSSYCEQEFDLGGLGSLRGHLLEIGRACVEPSARGGSVIALLWSGLVAYARERADRYLFGAVSISLSDGGIYASNVFESIRHRMLHKSLCVTPRQALNSRVLATHESVVPPGLLRAYLKAGALPCGEPAVDADFGTADIPMLLRLDEIAPAYSRHFLRTAVPA